MSVQTAPGDVPTQYGEQHDPPGAVTQRARSHTVIALPFWNPARQSPNLPAAIPSAATDPARLALIRAR
jgi:hypothetical protein